MTRIAATGPVTEKVTRTRVLSSGEANGSLDTGAAPEFWDYIESLTPDAWVDHIVYLYREDPKVSNYGGGYAYLDKFVGTIEVRPGVTVPMEDRGMMEAAIKEKFGGRAFRLICKRGRERITEGKSINEAAPKYPSTDPFAAGSAPLPSSHSNESQNAVAMRAMDVVGGQQPEAIKIAMDVMRSASDLVLRTNQVAAGPASQSRLLDDQLIASLITKALNPPQPPDPFSMFLKFKEVMGPQAPSNSLKETIEMIGALKNSGLLGAAGGRGNGLVDLGREVLPAVANAVTGAMREWRMGMEAQERGVSIARGINTPPANAALPAEIIRTAPIAMMSAEQRAANPGVPAPGAAVQGAGSEPPFQWIEQKIVEILKEPSFTVDEAVDEVLSFLYRAHPAIVALLLDPPRINPLLPAGEQGVLALFQNEPILQQVPVNPRLVEFIKKFIVAAKEAEAERNVAPAVSTAAPSVELPQPA